MRVDKLIKRKIRESKLFKKNSKVKIGYLKSKTASYILNLIEKINSKYNLNISLETYEFRFVEDLITNINKYNVIIAPSETVVTSFILYFSGLSERYFPLLFERKIAYNLGYEIAERYFNAQTSNFKEYTEIEQFVNEIFAKNEKFVRGSIKTIKILLEFLS